LTNFTNINDIDIPVKYIGSSTNLINGIGNLIFILSYEYPINQLKYLEYDGAIYENLHSGGLK